MKRKNATRSALFTSIISLLLCVSMLVGTTFAWFTDEVVSGTAGKVLDRLDVFLTQRHQHGGIEARDLVELVLDTQRLALGIELGFDLGQVFGGAVLDETGIADATTPETASACGPRSTARASRASSNAARSGPARSARPRSPLGAHSNSAADCSPGNAWVVVCSWAR